MVYRLRDTRIDVKLGVIILLLLSYPPVFQIVFIRAEGLIPAVSRQRSASGLLIKVNLM